MLAQTKQLLDAANTTWEFIDFSNNPGDRSRCSLKLVDCNIHMPSAPSLSLPRLVGFLPETDKLLTFLLRTFLPICVHQVDPLTVKGGGLVRSSFGSLGYPQARVEDDYKCGFQ